MEPVLGGGVHRQVPDRTSSAGSRTTRTPTTTRRRSTADTSFLNDHYDNPEIDKLLAEEKASTDDADAPEGVRRRSRRSAAEDAPTIPIWQGDQVAAVRDGVNGVEDTFDPAFIFRFWLISKD